MSAPSAPIIKTNNRVFPSSIRFYWSHPVTSGDSPISSYTLTCSSISFSESVPYPTINMYANSLSNNTSYTFQIYATNANGNSGTPATYIPYQTGTRPGIPSNVTASTITSMSSMYVFWSTPSINGSAITYNAVWVYPIDATSTILSNATSFSVKANQYGNCNSAVVPLPSVTSNYAYIVRAINSIGWSPDIPSAYKFVSFPSISYTFSPSSITGVSLWLDASISANFTTSGSNILTWSDRSSNAYTATKQGATNLILSTNAVHFTNSSYLSIPDSSPLRLQTASFSIFSVYRTVLNNQSQFLLSKFQEGGTFPGYNVRAAEASGSYNRPVWYAGGTPDYVLTNTATVDGTFKMLTVYQNSNVLNSYLNGLFEKTTSFTPPTNWTGQLNIGVRQTDQSSPFYGSIQEILMYTTFITPFDRQKVEGYLAWKWGLQTSLPITHPFYASKPLSNSVFTPSNFSGLQLWLDATQVTGYANGEGMTSWVDKSSNAFANSGSNAPTYQTNVLNAQPVVRFNGSTQFFNFSNVLNLGSNGISIFVLANIQNTNNTFGIIGKTVAGPGSGRWAILRESGNLNFLLNVTAGNNLTYSDSATGVRLMGAIWDRATMYSYSNATSMGTLSAVDSGSFSNTFPLYVGGYPNSSGSGPATGLYFNGDIAEVLVFNRALSTDDRQTVEGYLSWKWGQQNNLPTSHPYYNNNPGALTTYNVVTDNLILYLDPGNRASYPGSGTAFFDLSPARNHCTLVNSPTYSATEHGKFSFNGTNQYISTPIISITKPLTMSVWVKFANLTGWQTFAGLDTTNAIQGGQFYFQKAGSTQSYSTQNYPLFQIRQSDDGTTAVSGTVIATTGTWFNYTVSVSPTEMKFYTNGILNNTTTTSLAFLNPASNMLLNAGYYNNAILDYLNGDTSVFMMYSKTLSDAEVLQNYNAMKMKY